MQNHQHTATDIRDMAWQDIAKHVKSATGICKNVNQHWQIAI